MITAMNHRDAEAQRKQNSTEANASRKRVCIWEGSLVESSVSLRLCGERFFSQ